MKSYAKPTAEQLDSAIPMLSSPQHEVYFFGHLENPNWVTGLADRNIFRYPPEPESVEGGGVRFPPWAASQYLARMAALVPREVASIFAECKLPIPP